MSGRTNRENAKTSDTAPVRRYRVRSPAVSSRWKARAISMAPVVSAHAAIQMVSASAVMPGHASATMPAANESPASSSQPKTGPTLSLAKARALSVAAVRNA